MGNDAIVKLEWTPRKVAKPVLGVENGNLTAIRADGKKIRLVTNGLAMNDEEIKPQIAPDGKTVAWVGGEYQKASAGNGYYPTALVVWQGGRIRATIHGKERLLIEAWKFWESGKQVVTLTRGLHGPAFLELRDARTGKLLQILSTNDKKAEQLSWAKEWAGS
jgi:hypothetical protein